MIALYRFSLFSNAPCSSKIILSIVSVTLWTSIIHLPGGLIPQWFLHCSLLPFLCTWTTSTFFQSSGTLPLVHALLTCLCSHTLFLQCVTTISHTPGTFLFYSLAMLLHTSSTISANWVSSPGTSPFPLCCGWPWIWNSEAEYYFQLSLTSSSSHSTCTFSCLTLPTHDSPSLLLLSSSRCSLFFT